jgi:hypothetical protein
MARGKQSSGQCAYCGEVVNKAGVVRHLSACPKRQEVLTKADHSRISSERLQNLRVQANGQSMFWLDLEMRGTSSLNNLDDYLRAIWLECCGHMSQFSIGGWGGDEIPMRRKIDEVFEPGVTLTHIYDFGTSSETLIKSVSVREGRPTTSKPIALMMRNVMPEALCIECGQPARWFCNECMIEDDTAGTLCDVHAESHPHDNYGEPIEIVNSPRMGMCGYDGPATPPY